MAHLHTYGLILILVNFNYLIMRYSIMRFLKTRCCCSKLACAWKETDSVSQSAIDYYSVVLVYILQYSDYSSYMIYPGQVRVLYVYRGRAASQAGHHFRHGASLMSRAAMNASWMPRGSPRCTCGPLSLVAWAW